MRDGVVGTRVAARTTADLGVRAAHVHVCIPAAGSNRRRSSPSAGEARARVVFAGEAARSRRRPRRLSGGRADGGAVRRAHLIWRESDARHVHRGSRARLLASTSESAGGRTAKVRFVLYFISET